MGYGQEDTLKDFSSTDERILLNMFITSTTFLLPGDPLMLTFIHNHGFELNLDNVQLVDVDTIDFMTREKVPLYGVDFHTHQWIVQSIVRQCKLDSDKVKSLIWRCRSGVNYRKKAMYNAEDLLEWEVISQHVDTICRQILLNKA